MPEAKVNELLSYIKTGSIYTWEQVHAFYDESFLLYPVYKTTYAIYILEQMYSRPIFNFTKDIYEDILHDVGVITNEMFNSAVSSREKDYDDYFRSITFRNKEEQEAVIGSIEHNEFLNEMKPALEAFREKMKKLFSELC